MLAAIRSARRRGSRVRYARAEWRPRGGLIEPEGALMEKRGETMLRRRRVGER